MAKVIRTRIDAKLHLTMELSEDEARALEAIFGYNVDAFLKVFYERMGKTYVQPHEAGVRSLHATIRGVLSGPLRQVDLARMALRAAIAKIGAENS